MRICVRFKGWSLALFFALFMPAHVLAQGQVVVPNDFENTTGTHAFLSPTANSPRTYQLLIHEDQLADLAGKPLAGLAWRLPDSANEDWPAVDVVYDNYDIYLSGSVAPADRSLTFADNVVGPQTLVRSGPLTIPAGAFTSGASPNAFSFQIEFDSWPYAGGHLLVELRHTGQDENSRSNDAVGTANPGYLNQFAAAWSGGYDATSGAQGNFAIIQFTALLGFQVDPDSIELAMFPDDPAAIETVELANSGDDPVTWNIATAEPGDCDNPVPVPWITDINPDSGTLDPDTDDTVEITIDPDGLTPGGTFEASLCVTSNDPTNELVEIPVTLTVIDPNVATLEGTVNSVGFCGNADPLPIQDAQVLIEGQLNDHTVFTDADGFYQIDLDIAESPVDITVTDPDHLAGNATGVALSGGGTVVEDFDLSGDSACIDVDPADITTTLDIGDMGNETVDIGNVGTQLLEWSLVEPEPLTEGAAATISADGSREIVARGGDSDPLIGFTLKTAGSTGDDPQNWSRISASSGTLDNVPDDTGAATDVSLEWGVLAGSISFIATGTVAADAVPQYDYDLTGMNGYGFGGTGRYFFEFSNLSANVPYEIWFVGYRNTLGIAQTVEISDGDVPAAIVFDQVIASGDNNGRFLINEVVTDDTMDFNDLAVITNSGSDGTIRIEVERFAESTSVGAFAIRQSLDCELPEWLSLAPTSGSVPVGGPSDTVTVTFDADGLAPGTHVDAFCIESNDPSQPIVPVPVTLEVELGDFTAVEGTVTTAGYCNADPGPLAGATVEIFDSGGTLIDTLTTDENGFYETFLHFSEGPLDIEVSAAGHFGDEATGVATAPGATVTEDFELLLDSACADHDPDAHLFELFSGENETQTLTILNTDGNADLDWDMLDAVRGRGSVLWDAGPLVTHPGAGPGGTDHSTLQSQTLGMDILGFGMALSGAGPHIRIADEFVVTSNWEVDAITFFAYQTGSPGGSPPPSTITSVNYRIWDGPPDDAASTVVFGDTTTNRLQSTQFSNIYRVSETTVGTTRPIMEVVAEGGFSLSPGSYWVDWQMDGTVASGPWQPPITILGEDTTGHAKQLIDTGWQDVIDEGATGTGSLTPQGMPFIITGLAGGCWDPAEVDWLEVVPTSGTVAAGGSQTVDVSADATGLSQGEYNVALCINTSDAQRPLMTVPVTLIVEDPDAGTLDGVVSSGGHCGADPHPVEGALVTAVGQTMTFETATDENGEYMIPGINEDESPLEVTVTAGGYLDGMETGVMIAAQQTTTVDFELVLDAPCATVDPEMVEAEVGQGGTTSRTLVIGNEAGGADLSWTIQTAEPASSPEPAAMPTADTGVSSNGVFAAEDLASILGEALPSVPVVNPAGGVVDCDNEPGLIIHDDGTVENGYSYLTTVAWGAFIDRFTPDAYPVVFDSVCLAFVRAAGGPASMDFEIIVYADDGPGGAPGTELGVMQANVQGIPEWPISTPTWASFDISSLDIQIESGSVYIGARWVPSSPNVFLAADQSEDRPVGFAGGYTATSNNPDWQLTHTAGATFEPYRSMFIRAVASEAGACANPVDIPWLSVDPEAGNTPAGSTSQVTVNFDATGLELGVHEALLCVNSNDANNPRIEVPVLLSVLDLPPGELELTPSTLDFGTVEVGTTATGELTLTNIGENTFPVLVDSILVTGATFADTGDGSCEVGVTELASGDSCTIEIAFTPTGEGNFTGGVVVDGADGKLATAALSGTGGEVIIVDPIFSDRFEVPEEE